MSTKLSSPPLITLLNSLDKYAIKSYYVSMKNITNIIKQNYYQYPAGDFFVIRVDGEVTNMRDFHSYRIKQLLSDRRNAIRALTTQRG